MSNLIDKEYAMPYNVVESLKHMAAVKIVKILCGRKKIMKMITRTEISLVDISFLRNSKLTRKIQEKVKSCIRELQISKSLQNEILRLVELVVVEVLDWIWNLDVFVFPNFSRGVKAQWFIDKIVWQPQGMVDYVATARAIIKTKKLDSFAEFYLACAYALKDEKKVPGTKSSFDFLTVRIIHGELMSYWLRLFLQHLIVMKALVAWRGSRWSPSIAAHIIRRTSSFLIGHSAYHSWHKLNDDGKAAMSVAFAVTMGLRAPFVWPYITEIQEEEGFKKYGYSLLYNILQDAYWRKYFPVVLKRYRKMIGHDQLSVMLDYLNKIMKDSYRCRCVDFAEFLIELWDCTSLEARYHVIKYNNYDLTVILRHLHKDKMLNVFAYLFNDIDYDVIKNYLCSGIIRDLVGIADGRRHRMNILRLVNQLLSLQDVRRLKKDLGNIFA